MSDLLRDLLTRLRDDAYIRDGVEEVTRQGAILPILAALGWDRDNVREVVPEHAIFSGRIDYCLKVGDMKHVFIEVKRTSERLEDHEKQLLNYAFHDGVALAVLTNGISWWLYLPLLPGSWQERKFYVIDIQNQDIDAAATSLHNYLDRGSIANGSALERAQHEYYRQDKARIISATLPDAWRALCQHADQQIIDLLTEKVESMCGHKPDDDTIAEFLTRQVPAMPSTAPLSKARGPRSSSPKDPPILTHKEEEPSVPVEAIESTIEGYQNTKPVSFSLAGEHRSVSTYKGVLLGVSEVMYQRHPDVFEQRVLTLVGRKRTPFAKDGRAIRSPRLVAGTDIFVETNLSADNIMGLCWRLLDLFGHSRDELRVEAEPKQA